jgi:hypothetical protein
MVSDFVTPSVEQKGKMDSAQIPYMLNALYGKRPSHVKVPMMGTISVKFYLLMTIKYML